MIIARSITPKTGKPQDGAGRRFTKRKPSQTAPTPILATFPNLPAARAWLADQSDARAALVYLQYGPGDLI